VLRLGVSFATTSGLPGAIRASFTSLPSGHKKLILEFAIRSTANETQDGYIQFNTDTTAGNYRYRIWRNNDFGTANDGGSSYIWNKSSISCNDSDANGFTIGKIEIPQYDNANFNKVANINFGARQNGYVQHATGDVFWLNNSAITQLDIVLSGGNFAANSVLRLYYED